jgi:hypothetical protein
MIRCKLELLPGGIDLGDENQLLGEIHISNEIFRTIETGGRRGNYRAVIWKKRERAWTKVKLEDFPRQSYHPWEMVRRILNDAASRNGGHI